MILQPTAPVEVETRKNIFISQSRTGVRKVIVKSGAIRFYSLDFRNRDQEEYLEKLGEFEAYYPSTAFSWTNTDLGASGLHYFDSELKAVAENPDVFTYSIAVRTKDALVPTDPETSTFPFKPNFAYDITNVVKVLINDSVSFARIGKSTSGVARQFQYTFKNRTLTELQTAENFWNYHYPFNEVTFEDDVFDEDMTFFFDSNFKWTLNSVQLIDYTFVFTEVLTAETVPDAPISLTASATSDSEIDLNWSDESNNELGFALERCSGAACTGFIQVATVGAGIETYTDTGLSPNTLYRYRIRAFNSGGFSTYSNIAEDTTDSP